PLRAVIRISVALGISPNTLTLVGVLINCVAGWALAREHFVLAGFIMICANIFDFIDGKVAFITGRQSEFGAFWDSTLDRFSDLALFTGLIWLYAKLGREGYVLITTLTLIFATMTSYARTTIPYDLWVIAILAFVWLTPPGWLHDPVADGQHGFLGWLLSKT